MKQVRKPSHFLLMVLGWNCSEFLAMADFAEQVDNLLDGFMMCRMLTQGRHCVVHLVIDNTSHMPEGH
jgi:hypothetical protein